MREMVGSMDGIMNESVPLLPCVACHLNRPLVNSELDCNELTERLIRSLATDDIITPTFTEEVCTVPTVRGPGFSRVWPLITKCAVRMGLRLCKSQSAKGERSAQRGFCNI